MTSVAPPESLDVVAIAQRLLTAALNLEEDANICAIQPNLETFHAMLLSMAEMHTTLTASFRELALR